MGAQIIGAKGKEGHTQILLRHPLRKGLEVHAHLHPQSASHDRSLFARHVVILTLEVLKFTAVFLVGFGFRGISHQGQQIGCMTACEGGIE